MLVDLAGSNLVEDNLEESDWTVDFGHVLADLYANCPRNFERISARRSRQRTHLGTDIAVGIHRCPPDHRKVGQEGCPA